MQVQFTPPIFMMFTMEMGGALINALPCHACWYYVTCGHRHLNSFDHGGIYEHGDGRPIDDDVGPKLKDLAQKIPKMYGVTADEMLQYTGACKLQAGILKFKWDERVEYPLRYQYRKSSGGVILN